jgi:excisionase family DNA binding protein
MITVPEAAVRVGRNPETVRRWIRSGRLAATRVGTQLLVEERDLRAMTGQSTAIGEQRASYGIGALGDRPKTLATRTILVELDGHHAARLHELAARIHVSPEEVARSLLSSAVDQRDPDAATITAILDAIPGAWERAQVGLAEIRAGQGIRLEDL